MTHGGHTSVEPFKVRYHSTDLATDVISVKGYRGRCACGWVGQVRSHHSHARDDARRHRREEVEADKAASTPGDAIRNATAWSEAARAKAGEYPEEAQATESAESS